MLTVQFYQLALVGSALCWLCIAWLIIRSSRNRRRKHVQRIEKERRRNA